MNQIVTAPARTDSFIRYPRLDQLHRDIEMCRTMSKQLNEAHCMTLEGQSGAGKSTLVRSYLELFTRHETPQGSKIPILYVQTPSPISVKGMASAMLRHLGDPRHSSGTEWSMQSRVIHYIKQCDVKFVILDDFHHLIDSETKRVIEKVSDWLKVLIKETKVPYLVVGIEGRIGQILDTNAELRRLFAFRETLEPFEYGANKQNANKDFARFVKFASDMVGMPFSDELKTADLLNRIHYATDGVIAHIMNLLNMSVIFAKMEGDEQITLKALSMAFDKRFAPNMPNKQNPFARKEA